MFLKYFEFFQVYKSICKTQLPGFLAGAPGRLPLKVKTSVFSQNNRVFLTGNRFRYTQTSFFEKIWPKKLGEKYGNKWKIEKHRCILLDTCKSCNQSWIIRRVQATESKLMPYILQICQPLSLCLCGLWSMIKLPRLLFCKTSHLHVFLNKNMLKRTYMSHWAWIWCMWVILTGLR